MNWTFVLLIALPFIGGLLVIFPGRLHKMIRWFIGLATVIGTGIFLVLNILGKPDASITVWKLQITDKVSEFSQFLISPLGLILSAAFIFLWLIVMLYSFGYFKKETEADTEYYSLALFMLGSTLGILFTRDLIFIYLFWEIAAVTMWRLVGFNRDKNNISIAGRTILINFFGSALMLVGLLILIWEYKSFNLADMVNGTIAGNPKLVIAGIFILGGIFAKSAVIPLYIWVPAAYATSPAPAVALMAGAVENFGLIVYMKIFVQTLNVTPAWQITIIGIALASTIMAGGVAYITKDYRRILGYSTVSQLAFILIGFTVASQLGIIGAVLFILAHGLGKAALLLGYGAVERQIGDRDIMNKGRLVSKFPLLFVGLIIATLSIIGLPPLLGFFAKIDVLFATLEFGKAGVYLGMGLIAASIFTLLYMLRLISKVFLSSRNTDAQVEDTKVKQPIYLSILVLILSLALVGGSIVLKPLVAYLTGGGQL